MRQIADLFWSILDVIQRFPGIILFLIIISGIITVFIFQVISSRKSRPETKPITEDERKSISTRRPGKNYKEAILFISLAIIFSGGIILIGVFNSGSGINKESRIRSNSQYTFGIDISHYQGTIKWDKVKTSHHPIEYVIIRASMGTNGIDSKFKRNWNSAKNAGYIIGAYHYFRPNEDAKLQFNNFKKHVKLKSGDLPPILDVEKQCKSGNSHLVREVKKWMELAEAHYGVKPILYTGKTFYATNLENQINGYPLWLAAYSGKSRLEGIDWTFHQFSEKVRVTGIPHRVDGNDFNGSTDDLRRMCVGGVRDTIVGIQE